MHRAVPRLGGEQILLLLALLFLLRCVLDPWNIVYYELPFLLALLAWEALCRPERPPVLTLAATALVWITLQRAPRVGCSPDMQCDRASRVVAAARGLPGARGVLAARAGRARGAGRAPRRRRPPPSGAPEARPNGPARTAVASAAEHRL